MHRLHVSPRHGAPKVAQNYMQNTYRIYDFLIEKNSGKNTETYPEKVSKGVTLLLANVTWAPPWRSIGVPIRF